MEIFKIIYKIKSQSKQNTGQKMRQYQINKKESYGLKYKWAKAPNKRVTKDSEYKLFFFNLTWLYLLPFLAPESSFLISICIAHIL